MDIKKIKEFVLKAGKATYASGQVDMRKKQPDKSTTITFKDGEYLYHDNYFGGEPYGGREVVFCNKEPVWMMVYYGWVNHEQKADEVYNILMSALRMATLNMPYRGPKLYKKNEWRYTNEINGEFKRFSGTEKIFKGDYLVYEASYMGGLVNQIN
jgi:hypothetical protein